MKAFGGKESMAEERAEHKMIARKGLKAAMRSKRKTRKHKRY